MGKWIHRISNVNVENKTAICSYCGLTSVIYLPSLGRWRCKIAKRKYKGNGRISMGYKSGTCPICKMESEQLVYDHNHVTGKYREWLCHSCNLGLGLFKDNINNLKSAIEYLEKDK